MVARSDALLAIELDSLDDAALADHVHAALTLADDMIRATSACSARRSGWDACSWPLGHGGSPPMTSSRC